MHLQFIANSASYWQRQAFEEYVKSTLEYLLFQIEWTKLPYLLLFMSRIGGRIEVSKDFIDNCRVIAPEWMENHRLI